MYLLVKHKNNVYKLEKHNKIDENIKNYIILDNIKANVSKMIIFKIIKYNISILNSKNNNISITTNKINDIILVDIPYLSFVEFFKNIKI